MSYIEKIFGQKLFLYILLLIVGIIIFFSTRQIKNSELGLIIIIISLMNIIYEGRLRYYIKSGKKTYKFKSKGESFIAKYFDKKKIKYIYEHKLNLGSDKLTPDFYLPEFDVYVEYWGRWSNDFNYRKACREKRKIYDKYEKNLIELYPDNLTSVNQLDWKFTERLLNLLKKDRK